MSPVEVEVDPAEVGFDAGRLARHRPPLRALRRRRAAAGVAGGRGPPRPGRPPRDRTGTRDVEADLPIERRHALPHLLDDEADHVGGGDDALRGGRLRAEGPGQPVHPVVPRPAGLPQRVGAERPVLEPTTEPMRIWHLLTHTSGLTYGFHHTHPVDAHVPQGGLRVGHAAGRSTSTRLDQWSELPLRVPAGLASGTTRVSTDVLGRVVEVVSGQSLDRVPRRSASSTRSA